MEHQSDPSPSFHNVSQIEGRRVKFGQQWFVDFASCNYLGFDINQKIIDSIEPAIRDWGVHPSWCRRVASPGLYEEAEQSLAELIGCETTVILPTVSLIGFGVIPLLSTNQGMIWIEKNSHVNLHEACKISKANGCRLYSFENSNLIHLEEELSRNKFHPVKMIIVDAVNKTSGNYAPLDRLVALARKYDSVLYIDDAHGFGLLGEAPTPDMPYGFKGNGSVNYFGQGYSNIIYVGGLSKAYSAHAAFIGCDQKTRKWIESDSIPYAESGPCSIATLQTILTGLAINNIEGDALRRVLHTLSAKIIISLRNQGFFVENITGFPIISVYFHSGEELNNAHSFLKDAGILTALVDETLRITVTARNTEEEVNMLLAAFSRLNNYTKLKIADQCMA